MEEGRDASNSELTVTSFAPPHLCAPPRSPWTGSSSTSSGSRRPCFSFSLQTETFCRTRKPKSTWALLTQTTGVECTFGESRSEERDPVLVGATAVEPCEISQNSSKQCSHARLFPTPFQGGPRHHQARPVCADLRHVQGGGCVSGCPRLGRAVCFGPRSRHLCSLFFQGSPRDRSARPRRKLGDAVLRSESRAKREHHQAQWEAKSSETDRSIICACVPDLSSLLVPPSYPIPPTRAYDRHSSSTSASAPR